MQTRLFFVLAVPAMIACSQATSRTTASDLREAEANAKQAIATETTIRADTIPIRAVAVAPLRVDAADTSLIPLGYGLADFVMADLAKSSQLVVVNRLRMDAVLRELDLASSGRVDSTSAPRVGRLMGAGRMITGTLTGRGGGSVAIGTQIVRTTTGETRLAVAANAPLAQILRAQKELTFRIFEQLGVTLTPAERASVEEFQTQNLSAMMSYSRGVQYETEGRFGAAAREFKKATQLDPSFALAGQRATAMLSLNSSLPLTRALAMTGGNVNRPLFRMSAVERGGATDPSFRSAAVIITVTITTPP